MPKADAVPTTDLPTDPFAFARADDAQLLSLFQQWVEGARATARYGRENPEHEDGFNALDDANWELARRMATMPALGAAGLAVKAYMFAWCEAGGSYEDAPAVCGLGGDEYVSTQMLLSLLRDLPAFVPELASLVRYAAEDRGDAS